MDKGIARAVAATAVVVMFVLGGCGASAGSSSGGAAPAGSGASSSTSASDPAWPTPASDPGQDTKAVQAATTTFVTAVLTIGYPDKSFDSYTDRIKPLMTKDGFDSLENADSVKTGSKAVKTLYAQHARSAPKFTADPAVTSLESDTASAQVDYENLAQQEKGGDWTTLKSLGTGSVTVRLVLQDGAWLVDDAS